MTARTRKCWSVALGSVAAIAALLFHFKQRDSYGCQGCLARKDVFQWRLGAWMDFSIPLTPSWERITESRFLRAFLPPGHTHVWKFAQGSPYHFFGTTWGGCALGEGRRVSKLCEMYESNRQFRRFLLVVIDTLFDYLRQRRHKDDMTHTVQCAHRFGEGSN